MSKIDVETSAGMIDFSEMERLVNALFDPEITTININKRTFMQVKPCPGCDGTGKDNSEPEFECEYCCEGKPGWIIA